MWYIYVHVELEALTFKTENENNQRLKYKCTSKNVYDSEICEKKTIHFSPEFNDDPPKILTLKF